MKFKTMIALVLSMALLTASLSGCAGKGNTDSGNSATASAAEKPESGAAEESKTEASATTEESKAEESAAVESAAEESKAEESKAEESAASEESKTAEEPAAEQFVLEYPADMQAQGFTEPLVLDAKPERIVSLTVAPVLALYEMGANFVGVVDTVTVTWPDEIMAVSGLVSFNAMSSDDFDYESVVNLNPDLVFVSAYGKTAGETLEGLDIPVYYINAGHAVDIHSIQDMTKCIVDAFSVDEESKAKADEIMGRFDKMWANADKAKEAFAGKTVMVLQSAMDTHYIQSSMGTLGTMADMIGFENVFSEAMMAPLDYEQALDYDPDIVMCVGATDAETHKALMEAAFAENPEYWNAIPAIEEGRVLYLPSAYVSTAGINVINCVNDLIEIVADYYGVEVEIDR